MAPLPEITAGHAIGYLRVSTSEQGRSGLGLAAQRHDIENFGAREGFTIQSWHEDVQTGAGKDALLLRPGLAEALKGARALSLAYLAPDLTEAILDGRQPPRLMVKHIRTNDIPLEWNAQRRLFARFNE